MFQEIILLLRRNRYSRTVIQLDIATSTFLISFNIARMHQVGMMYPYEQGLGKLFRKVLYFPGSRNAAPPSLPDLAVVSRSFDIEYTFYVDEFKSVYGTYREARQSCFLQVLQQMLNALLRPLRFLSCNASPDGFDHAFIVQGL